MVYDGVHDRPPAHPELPGDDGDGQGELAHLAGRLGTGAQGQHRPRRHVLGSLGPGLGRTVWIGAAPATLEPDQSGWATEAGQVPDVDAEPILGSAHAHPGGTADQVAVVSTVTMTSEGVSSRRDPKAVESQQSPRQGQ